MFQKDLQVCCPTQIFYSKIRWSSRLFIIFRCFSPEDPPARALSGKEIFIMWIKQGRSVAWRYPSLPCPGILILNSFQISNKCLCLHQHSHYWNILSLCKIEGFDCKKRCGEGPSKMDMNIYLEIETFS